MLFNQGIYKKIIDVWTRAARLTNRPEMLENIPQQSDLSHLVELVFFASLKREEGHTVQTRLIFVENEQSNPSLVLNRYHGLSYLPFSCSVKLTPDQLRKISLGFDQSNAALVITKSSKEYLINGVFFYGSRLSIFNSAQGSYAIPQNLVLSCSIPGCVNVSYGDFVIGRLMDGTFTEADPGPMASQVFVQHILPVIQKQEGYKQLGMSYWHHYRNCLTELYKITSQLQKGGTIIWLPKAIIDEVENDLSDGWKFKESISAKNLLEDYVFHSHQKTLRIDGMFGDVRQRLCDHIEMLARMTSVDGALIIDEEFKPLYFGTHLASKALEGKVYRGPILSNEKKIEFKISGGTRHESAIKFIGSHPGAIALVASEDGPVRAIINCHDGVYLWPDCTNTVFLD